MVNIVWCGAYFSSRRSRSDNNKTFPSLWFGTYAYVCAYILYVPPKRNASDGSGTVLPPVERTRAVKGKEITFKHHKAPIIGITVFDVNSGLPLELATDPSAHELSPHRVVIATEEQFKVFSLPEMSVKDKYKLTAKEGVRIRRMSFARFTSAPPKVAGAAGNAVAGVSVPPPTPSIALHAMLCLTNAGDCIIFSVPDLKKKLNAAAVRREDIK